MDRHNHIGPTYQNKTRWFVETSGSNMKVLISIGFQALESIKGQFLVSDAVRNFRGSWLDSTAVGRDHDKCALGLAKQNTKIDTRCFILRQCVEVGIFYQP